MAKSAYRHGERTMERDAGAAVTLPRRVTEEAGPPPPPSRKRKTAQEIAEEEREAREFAARVLGPRSETLDVRW